MKPKDIEQLAGQVSPQNARQYALAHGWLRVPVLNGGTALFQRADAGLDQLIVPLQSTGPDYARRIVDVVTNLSERERRPPEEILDDLLMSDLDIVRYRLISPDSEKGDVSLAAGLSMIEGARRSLLAVACSVISPASYHPRMSRTEALELLDACRLMQTERNSFTVAIACPLRFEGEQISIHDAPASPFARKTTVLLLQSLHRLVQSIEADEVDSFVASQRTQPVISANLCDALLEMKPKDKKAQLKISVSWASTLPYPATPETSKEVALPTDYFSIIEDVYWKLRPSLSEPAETFFIGYVDALNGKPGTDGRMQGETRFVLFQDEEKSIKARSDLGSDDYQKAVQAHRTARIVKFNGILYTGRRTHQITNVKLFEILEPIPTQAL